VALDIRLTWSLYIDQARKRAAQRMGMLGPLLNRKSDLSIRNEVLYKERIHAMMNYMCPAWRSVSLTHVRILQLLGSKCLRLATGDPWYVRYRHVHEDVGVALFSDHIRDVTENFDSKFVDVGNPLLRHLVR